MNLVGKIFTVLIFLMCVVFGTFALMVHAAHKNWKEVVVAKGGLNDQLIEANKQKQDLDEEKKNLETALDDEKKADEEAADRPGEARRRCRRRQRDDNEKQDSRPRKARAASWPRRFKRSTSRLGVLQTASTACGTISRSPWMNAMTLQKKLVDTTDELMNAVAERQAAGEAGARTGRPDHQVEGSSSAITRSREDDKAKNPPPDWKAKSPPSRVPTWWRYPSAPMTAFAKAISSLSRAPARGKYIGMIEVIQVDYPNRAVCRPDKAMLSDQIQKGDHVKAYTKPR